MRPENERSRPEAVRLVVRHYAAQLRRDWGLAAPAMLLPALGDILVIYVPPLVIARVISLVARGTEPSVGRLWPYVVLFACVWLAGEASWRVGAHYLNALVARGLQRLYEDAMRFLLEKDLAFFHDNFAGSLTKKALAYARSYDIVISTLSFDIFNSTLPLIFVGFVLWRFSPLLFVALIACVLLTIAAVVPLIRRRRTLVDAREAASNALAGHVADSIGNIEAVRAFAREDFEAVVHARNVRTFVTAARRSWDYQNLRISLVTSPFYVLTNAVGLLLALAVGGGSAASIEAVFITFAYYTAFSRVMWEFHQIYRNIEAYMAEAAQFGELLLEPPRVVDAASPAPHAPRDASIEFRNVRFRFHDRSGEHLFEDLSFRVESGEKIGLVGRSGGGKTTVTRLLLRFMDVESGEILVGAQNVATIRQGDLRSIVAYVPQDPVMFHRTLADNIRFGRLPATDEEVREAARLAHASEFIEALPLGFGTLVGERGIKLSGGQRQRVAIARAILKDAPILVLDEATSSLDGESERLIQDALWRLMQNRTAIVIAHRLSTVQRMDRLVVLEQGRLVEQGSHRELLAAGGSYAVLWAHQSGGFLEDADEGAAAEGETTAATA